MYHEPNTDESGNKRKLEIKNGIGILQDQMFRNKVELELYLHFERLLAKQRFHYKQKSQFFGKKLSKQQITNETIKYLNYLKENVKPLPPQHNQQLLFLINYFNNQNKLITNHYYIDILFQYLPGPSKFILSFDGKNSRIDLKQFLNFNNWNHLRELLFDSCDLFQNDDWRALVQHAHNFKNLKTLLFSKCFFYGFSDQAKITLIKKEDIQQFESLASIYMEQKFLSEQSKQVLQRLNKRINESINQIFQSKK